MTSCSRGKIYRKSYTRKSYNKRISVPGSCITATSQTGRKTSDEQRRLIKGKQLFILEKDRLKPYGYENINDLTISERRRALNRALKKEKPLSLYRRLNALSLLFENRDPVLSKKFKDDSEYVKTTKEYLAPPPF